MAHIQKRTSSKGKTSYRAQVRLRGYPKVSATFERKTDAQKWAQATETAIRENRYFKTSESQKHTFGEMIERYRESVMPHKSKIMREKQRVQLEWWEEQLGEHLLSKVTPSLIVECRDKLRNLNTRDGHKRSPSTVNRYLAALSHVFNVAANEWEWLDDSPMRKVGRLKEPSGRERFLDQDEKIRLLEACRNSDQPLLYPVVLLAISTGARKMEILNLRWKDVNLSKGTAILQQTKNGEKRVIHITGPVLKELKKHSKFRHIKSDLIFAGRNPDSPIELRKPWVNALKDAGIENFRFHDLRHTAASYLIMSGATLAETAEILGHKTLQMVKRYAHLSDQHTARVVTKMNEKFLGDLL